MLIKVRRDNVVLSIDEFQKERYLNRGFSVIDANGEVVEKTTPRTLAALKSTCGEQAKQIEEMTATIKKLKAEIASLKKETSKPKKKPELK